MGLNTRCSTLPSISRAILFILSMVILFLSREPSAHAIPSFARKYGTSCLTCHTTYPKLNPFGEAFRRNGFRFPGVDSDYTSEKTIPLGQESYKKVFPQAVWPATIPANVPAAIGFNGQAIIHPDDDAGATRADNGTHFTLNDLVEEGHLWAGGSFTDTITFFSEISFSSDGADIEHAVVLFNDLVGPKHLLNLVVGKAIATLSSFGAHSSYVADMASPTLSVTALGGSSSDSWNIGESYNGIELNGMVRGRFSYAVGLNAGANIDIRPTDNCYVHLGLKLGGMRLDGEGSETQPNSFQPWSEKSLTLDAFFYRSKSRFNTALEQSLEDRAYTFGGAARLQWSSLEINAGIYQERHNHVLADGAKVHALSQYDEVSYVVFPWLVPAVRFEYLRFQPGGSAALYDWRIIPGIAALVLPNLKLSLTVTIEKANGTPPGSWSPAGGSAMPTAESSTRPAVESIALGVAYAF